MSFPEQPFGFVAGRWVRSIGDTPDDADRAPDYVSVETGTVTFTPQVTHRVAPDNTGWAGIIKEKIPARLGERGQLIDAEGHDHLALAAGVYSVSYDFGYGRSWPSHYIEVNTTHTAEAPLWLPPIAPPAEGPMIENRVVTIPADGTDGQVLVWDGAGFSWMDAPAGPKGDPGEVTTAALTTALAGKVTGTGMTVRVDTSVGTRVLLDHPGGTTMLYGDTGWRDVSTSLESGWTGTLRIRRVNNQVFLHGNDLDATSATNVLLYTLATGFRPAISKVPINAHPAGLAPIYARAFNTIAQMDRTTSPTVARDLAGTWLTNNDWPTTLPGLPL